MYLHLPKLPRFLTAAAGSAFVTTGLVFLMVQLITIDDDGFVEAPPPVSIDYYEVREDLPIDPTPHKVEPPPVVEVEPTPPPLIDAIENTAGVEFAFVAPKATKAIQLNHTALTDGEHIPIVKVQPVYPNQAARRGIEGYVILSFTILPSGATANAEVIESHPSGVFNNSALKAVQRFKYKPKVVDGEARAVHNVHHRLSYELASG